MAAAAGDLLESLSVVVDIDVYAARPAALLPSGLVAMVTAVWRPFRFIAPRRLDMPFLSPAYD